MSHKFPSSFFSLFSRNSLPSAHDTALSPTLSLYLVKKFFFAFISALSALSLLIALFDFIDLLRRAASSPDVSFLQILELASLHLPYYLIYIFPFAALLGGMISFSKLARSSEITIISATGISPFQFLLPPFLCAFLLGVLTVAFITPLSAFSYQKSQTYMQKWFQHQNTPHLITSVQGIWLRQNDENFPLLHQESDLSETHQGMILLKIPQILARSSFLEAQNITLFHLDNHHQLRQRLLIENAILCQNKWQFHHIMLLRPSLPPLSIADFSLPSDLTENFIKASSAPADSLSFWSLPKFIQILTKSGFPTVQQRLRLQSLLALPILAGTMVLVSAGFSTYSTRKGGIIRLLSAGIAVGFALFTISKIAEQLGKSGALPPLIAAWVPSLAALCLSAALLLHMEDGQD